MPSTDCHSSYYDYYVESDNLCCVVFGETYEEAKGREYISAFCISLTVLSLSLATFDLDMLSNVCTVFHYCFFSCLEAGMLTRPGVSRPKA